MNTMQLECFVTVAEYLNFSKAAEALKMTQPAVSHQIRSLEEELEVKLFLRTSKSVSLTQEGILFLADAHQILRTALSAGKRLRDHAHFIPFDLGCRNHMEANLLPPVLKLLYQEFPLLRPAIRLIPFSSLLDLVENGQLQAALSIKEEQNRASLSFRELCSAPICCICSPEHPLAAYEVLKKKPLSGNLIACAPRQIPDAVLTIQNSILANLPPRPAHLYGKYRKRPDSGQSRAGLCRLSRYPRSQGTGASLHPGGIPADSFLWRLLPPGRGTPGFEAVSKDTGRRDARLILSIIFSPFWNTPPPAPSAPEATGCRTQKARKRRETPPAPP